MALETATYISDLVATNPAAADSVAQGDDHIRLLKSTVKATFPNVTGAVNPTQVQLNYLASATGTTGTTTTNVVFSTSPSITTPTIVGATMTGNLLFTDNTYDIGASGATRPRDFFLGRNATVGGTLNAGATTIAAINVPFTVNSTNSNSNKLGFQDNGVVKSYLGATATNLLTVADSGGTDIYTFTATLATVVGVTASAAIRSTGTGGVGYAAGAGGTVTQATNKGTSVTLNKICGDITMNAAALAADTNVSFVLSNNTIEAADNIILNHVSGGTVNAYMLNVSSVAAGSTNIDVRNITAGSLSEAIVIRFTVIKSVTS